MSAVRIVRLSEADQRRRDAEMRVRDSATAFVNAVVDLALASGQQQPRPPVELLSVEEFARRAGVARSTLWGLVNRAEVGSVKIGGRRVIPASELDRIADAATRRRAGADR
jgi:excisionase family DNA binding protein